MRFCTGTSFVISLFLWLTLFGCGGGSKSTPAPAAPTSLTATASNAQVSLTWTASPGATSYNVLRSISSGGSYSSIAIDLTTTTYEDSTVSNGTTYYFVVQAVNSGGTSSYSNQASATPGTPEDEIQARVTANQTSFYVYKDQDSGFNHGFPSGFFTGSTGTTSTIHLDAGCIDNPADTVTGCYSSTTTTALDTVHGTVMRISFDAQTDYNGVNIEEPQNWGSLQTGNGYDLRGVQNIVFDVRSPDMGTVQFGVGQCVTPEFQQIPQTW